MPWTSAFSAQFAKPLLLQTVAIIQRDQAAAIADVSPSLTTINEFHFGRAPRTALPWLAISADGPLFERDDDLNYRKGDCVLTLDLDVGEIAQEEGQFLAHDYARVLDEIIVSAGPWPSLQDWTTPMAVEHVTAPNGVTVPNAAGTVKEVMVMGHKYTIVTPEGYPAPLIRSTLTVRFSLIEE